jgi:hypothetical protein
MSAVVRLGVWRSLLCADCAELVSDFVSEFEGSAVCKRCGELAEWESLTPFPLSI